MWVVFNERWEMLPLFTHSSSYYYRIFIRAFSSPLHLSGYFCYVCIFSGFFSSILEKWAVSMLLSIFAINFGVCFVSDSIQFCSNEKKKLLRKYFGIYFAEFAICIQCWISSYIPYLVAFFKRTDELHEMKSMFCPFLYYIFILRLYLILFYFVCVYVRAPNE